MHQLVGRPGVPRGQAGLHKYPAVSEPLGRSDNTCGSWAAKSTRLQGWKQTRLQAGCRGQTRPTFWVSQHSVQLTKGGSSPWSIWAKLDNWVLSLLAKNTNVLSHQTTFYFQLCKYVPTNKNCLQIISINFERTKWHGSYSRDSLPQRKRCSVKHLYNGAFGSFFKSEIEIFKTG